MAEDSLVNATCGFGPEHRSTNLGSRRVEAGVVGIWTDPWCQTPWLIIADGSTQGSVGMIEEPPRSEDSKRMGP